MVRLSGDAINPILDLQDTKWCISFQGFRPRIHDGETDLFLLLVPCGLKTPPPWLSAVPLLEGWNATEAQRRRAYRQYVEAPVRSGLEDSLLNEALTGLVVGAAIGLWPRCWRWQRATQAQPQAVQRRHRALAWEAVPAAVVSAKQEPWEAFCNRRGDAGRDLALLVGRRFGRYSLIELGGLAGVSYAAVAQAVAKAEKRLPTDKCYRAAVFGNSRISNT